MNNTHCGIGYRRNSDEKLGNDKWKYKVFLQYKNMKHSATNEFFIILITRLAIF